MKRFKLPLIALAVAATRLPAIAHLPTPGDEVSYAAGASVILNGGALYRDFLDHKPPLIYYTYAAVFGATSDYNLVAVHLVLMLFVAATGLVLGRVVRTFLAPGVTNADLIAALLYVIFSATFVDFAALDANAELFLNLPMALALWAWLKWRSTENRLHAFAAGVLVAVATLYKYQAAALVVPIAIDVVRLRQFKSALALGAGLLLPAAAAVAFFAAAGTLDALWQRGVLYNFQFLGDAPAFSASLLALSAVVAQVIVPASVLYLFGVGVILFPASPTDRVVRWWFVALLPAVAMGGRFFPHYFLVLLVPLVALATRTITAALSGHRGAVVAIALALPALGLNIFQWARPAIARATGNAEPDLAGVASVVRAQSAPDDLIFMWGQAYPVYALSKRTPAARLIFWSFRADPQAPPSELESKLLADILADLEKYRARVVVDVGPESFRQAPALAAYVVSKYRLVATFAIARVHVRSTAVD